MSAIIRQRRQNPEALYFESPELRREVQNELRNWGRWLRTIHWPVLDIGLSPMARLIPPTYKDETDMERLSQIPADVDQAEATEQKLVELMARDICSATLLVEFYAHRLSIDSICKQYRISRKTGYRRIEQAEADYWEYSR